MVNERIRELRASLGLSQRDFSVKTNIGHSTLAMFETGERTPKDIHISQICVAFHVNEDWLRNGRGEMFNDSDQSILDNLQLFYGLSYVERSIVETFVRLPGEHRDGVLHYLVDLVHALETGLGYEEFRDAYISAYPKAYAARHGKADDKVANEVVDMIDESTDESK